MRDRRGFRPDVSQNELEDRVVLASGAGAGGTNLLAGLTLPGPGGGILSQIRDQYIRQFEVGYNELADAIVAAASSLNLQNSRPTFNAEAALAFDALNADVTSMLALSPLAKNRLTPAVQASIDGAGSGSMESLLAGVPTPLDASQLQAILPGVVDILKFNLQDNINRLTAFFDPNNPVRQAIPGSNAPVNVQIHDSYTTQFQASFQTFSAAYAGAVSGTLLNASSASQIAANRPAFDLQVQTLVNTLQRNLTTMLTIVPPAATTLTPSVEQSLTGSSNSLLTGLAALPTPTDTNGASAQAFEAQSESLINATMSDILAQLDSFFKTRGDSPLFGS